MSLNFVFFLLGIATLSYGYWAGKLTPLSKQMSPNFALAVMLGVPLLGIVFMCLALFGVVKGRF